MDNIITLEVSLDDLCFMSDGLYSAIKEGLYDAEDERRMWELKKKLDKIGQDYLNNKNNRVGSVE